MCKSYVWYTNLQFESKIFHKTMSAPHEIVTIQAGNYANFIGTHWWNLQESSFCYDTSSSTELDISHDVLFREGINYKGEVTFTPRLVLIDVKESLRSVRKEGPLYASPEQENNPLWDGAVDVVQQTPVKSNPFLEDAARNNIPPEINNSGSEEDALKPFHDFEEWSDYLKTNLHPRSFCLIDELTSENRCPLETYSLGEDIYLKSANEMIENTIRTLTEECDYLQGFQLISDSYNGFSSISNHVLQHLDDEYGRNATLCFPTFHSDKISPYQDVKDDMHRLYAILLSLSGMTSYASLFSPLSFSSDVVRFSQPFTQFPFLTFDVNNRYESSSLLAATLETVTSQFRLKSMKFGLSDVTSAMSMYSRKLVCSSVSLPFPESAFLSSVVQREVPEYYMTSVSPFYDPPSERTLFQSAVLRGVPRTQSTRGHKPHCQPDPEQIFGEYLNKYSSSSVTTVTLSYEKCSVEYPFPKVFQSLDGPSGIPGKERVPVAGSFSSSNSAAPFVDCLLDEAGKMRFREYIKSAESSFDRDEFTEVLQNLMGLTENYRDC